MYTSPNYTLEDEFGKVLNPEILREFFIVPSYIPDKQITKYIEEKGLLKFDKTSM